ncbi:NAD(P)H-hydrate dehydratase [Chloroflexota bacterium]
MKIVTSAQMNQIDKECAKHGLPTEVLMENAGKAIAEEVKKILGDVAGKGILVLTGPGNNGGDGLVAARYLREWEARVGAYLCSVRPDDDKNLQMVRDSQIILFEIAQDKDLEKLEGLLKGTDVVIDAIFGTGSSRPMRGNLLDILQKVNMARKERDIRIIAVDLPSGMNADTGAVDPFCLRADNTITLGLPKIGMYIFPGAEYIGKVTVMDIGIPEFLSAQVNTELITEDWVKSALPARPVNANKGTFGKVLVVAGSINYIGAAYLACSGVIRAGAGLATLATAASLQPALASGMPEVTYLPLRESRPGIVAPESARLIHEEVDRYKVMQVGCGLGQTQSSFQFIRATLLKPGIKLPSLVLDADALNALSAVPNWWQQLAEDGILTPHPGEMARLTSKTIDEVLADKFAIIRMASAQWNKTVVLKGAYTFVCASNGLVRISPFANAGLASAGTGDVLSGIIAGLLAQGLAVPDAAACGVYLHGLAGETVKAELGDAGMLASDLLPVIPRVIKAVKSKV